VPREFIQAPCDLFWLVSDARNNRLLPLTVIAVVSWAANMIDLMVSTIIRLFRERRREDPPHLRNDFIVMELCIFFRRSVCLHCANTHQSTPTETQPQEKEFTKERHDILLTLSLLNSFAFGFDEPSSELVNLATVLP